MLEELAVRNYALIDNLRISFEGGLNILTGETGAGKSIIVGSISFLLGSRAGAEIIRTGAEEAEVSAVIRVRRDCGDALDWLAARDLALDDERLIVRRNIRKTGRGSIFIQNVPVTRNDLAECMGLLFDIHGQHEHEGLLRKETHRKYLDRFAGIEREARDFNQVFLELSEKRKAFERVMASKKEREERIELLRYSVDEIDKAAVKSGESRELEAEASRLASFEKLSVHIAAACEAMFEEEASVAGLARKAHSLLDNAAAIDPGLAALEKRAADLHYEAGDISAELRIYRDSLTFNAGRLEEVEERLALLQKFKKKYPAATAATLFEGSGEDAVLAWREKAAVEIEALSGTEENREKLKDELLALERDIRNRARSLSAKRREASAALSRKISAVLTELGMSAARFSVSLEAKGNAEDGSAERPPLVLGPWGADDVEFLFSANLGEPVKELSRIASGGELSRVMLAIKTALSETGQGNGVGSDNRVGDASPETLVFDEIDAGIGGAVALAVGEYLAKIGKWKQIFCITHLASIAVRSDNHLKVEKSSDGKRTVTSVVVLDAASRRREIARMLAGDTGAAALTHADELIAKYGVKKGGDKNGKGS